MKLFQTIRAAAAGVALGFRAAFGAYSDVTRWTPDRGSVMFYLPQDTRQYICSWSRLEILRKVEWLFQNFGVVKEGARGIARHTVAKGISLQINSTDEEWNELAEADFEDYAMSASRFDRAGRRNFYEAQNHAVFQRIKAGEFFASFSDNPRWNDAPCVQLWDSTEVATPDELSGDPMVIDGVRLDSDHCPVAYYVRTLGGSYKPIPASAMIHWFHADGTNQTRGVSEFAQAVAPFADTREAINITSKTAKQNSAIGLHIKRLAKKGGQGGLSKIETETQRFGGGGGSGTVTPSESEPAYERLAGGGAVIYTDENGDAKFLTPQSPTPLLEPFITKVLMRNGFASIAMPAEFFWSLSELNGTSVRLVNAKADLVFDWFGDGLIGRFCAPVALRYLLYRIENGDLPPCKDPNWISKMHWQRPAKLSVDRGDAAVEIQQLANGIETLANINDRRGRGWRPQTRQWFKEFAYAARCAKECAVEWALPLWRASMPGAGGVAPGGQSSEQDEVEETEVGKKKKAA